MPTPNHEVSVIFSEPTVELAGIRLVDEYEKLFDSYNDFRAIAVSKNGRNTLDVRKGKLSSSFGHYEGAFPQGIFSGEQGTGLLRHHPDFFVVYDLAELIEAGISKGDLYDIAQLNHLGHGLILGYAREPRVAASERSILFADLFVDALKSRNQATVAKTVELIRADWS